MEKNYRVEKFEDGKWQAWTSPAAMNAYNAMIGTAELIGHPPASLTDSAGTWRLMPYSLKVKVEWNDGEADIPEADKVSYFEGKTLEEIATKIEDEVAGSDFGRTTSAVSLLNEDGTVFSYLRCDWGLTLTPDPLLERPEGSKT